MSNVNEPVAQRPIASDSEVPHFGDLEVEGAQSQGGIKNWFGKLVALYLRRRYAGAEVQPNRRTRVELGTETERAEAVTRRACIRSALAGGAVGTLATGATILTAETEGLASVVTVPTTLASIGVEMTLRSILHLQLTCDLADIFAVRFDPDDPQDLWRIFALAFGTEGHGHNDDPGKELVEKVVHVQGHEIGEKIGAKLLGESVARSVIPVVGIATSAIGNWRLTQRLGDTVRRYVRYRRALHDAFLLAEDACREQHDLLVEGMWFIFSADGRLNSEEAAVLASQLRKFDPVRRAAISQRFVEDEMRWLERLTSIPEAHRDAFLTALEVAATVDKIVALPERKILRHAARVLGREFDPERLRAMIKRFEDVGVLDPAMFRSRARV